MRRFFLLLFFVCSVIFASGGFQFDTGGGGGGGLTSPVGIADGGTGQTSAANAINALLPSQGGNTGEVLFTDATNPAWATGIAYTAASQSTVFTPTGSSGTGVQVTSTGMTGDTNAFKVSGAMGGAGTFRKGVFVEMSQPSSTGGGYGVRADITSSGTTSGWTRSFYTENTATVTSTTGDPINSTGGSTGYMTYINTNGTTGAAYGGAFNLVGGNYQNGLFISVHSGAGAAAKSYGVRSNVTNQTGSGTAEAVAGYFKINTTAVPTSTLGTSAALAADNGDTTSPILVLADGGFGRITVADGASLRMESALVFVPSAVDLGADNQTLTVSGTSHVRLTSNDTTATNRTFSLGDGASDGQVLTLEWNEAVASGAGEMAEVGGQINLVSTTTWTPDNGDIIRLTWNAGASEWREISRVDN